MDITKDLQCKFSGLRKTFAHKVLLDNESLNINQGELHLVCGDNGAGKTTLLRILAGLEKPDCATVTMDNRTDTWCKQRKSLQQASVYLHQFPYMLDCTVKKNLQYALKHRGIRGHHQHELIDEAVHLAQIEKILFSHAKTLSGGEQQRVALARAWLRNPRVMFMDEPTANMDQESRARTTALLGRLKSQGMALFVASHDPAQFTAISDTSWILEAGHLRTFSITRANLATVHKLFNA